MELTNTVDQYWSAQTENSPHGLTGLRHAQQIEDCIEDAATLTSAGTQKRSTDHGHRDDESSVSNSEQSRLVLDPRHMAVGGAAGGQIAQFVTGARSPLHPTTPVRRTPSIHEHTAACCSDKWSPTKGSQRDNLHCAEEVCSHSTMPDCDDLLPVSICPETQAHPPDAAGTLSSDSYAACKDGRDELERYRALNSHLVAQTRHFQASCEQLQQENDALRARAGMHTDSIGAEMCNPGADVMVDQLAMQLQDVMQDRARLKMDNERLECEYLLLELKLATSESNAAGEADELVEEYSVPSDENTTMDCADSVKS